MILDNELLAADDVLLEPQFGKLHSRSDATMKPFIYSAPMDRVTGFDLAKAMLEQKQIPVICREIDDEEYISCIREFNDTSAFFATGATKPEVQRLLHRIKEAALPDEYPLKLNIAIDIAHGDSIVAKEAIQFLKELPFINNIMSGSIATFAAALRNIEWGCTHLRIGIGCGSACSTRLMTGVGVPQLSAVYLIRQGLDRVITEAKSKTITDQLKSIQLIADGGIRYPGDAAKYLAAGANGIMMGKAFSIAKESLGWEERYVEIPPNKVIRFPMPEPEMELIKTYRGHASYSFQQDYSKPQRSPEGVSSNEFKWLGDTVESICEYYKGGVESTVSYLGLESIEELSPENVYFLKVTHNTNIESNTNV